MSEIGGKRLRMQRVPTSTWKWWAITLSVLRQFFNVGKLFHDLGLSCLQRLATPPHLADVGRGDEPCVALPFLDSGVKLFHCFFEIVESFLQGRLCCARTSHPERSLRRRFVGFVIFQRTTRCRRA